MSSVSQPTKNEPLDAMIKKTASRWNASTERPLTLLREGGGQSADLEKKNGQDRTKVHIIRTNSGKSESGFTDIRTSPVSQSLCDNDGKENITACEILTFHSLAGCLDS